MSVRALVVIPTVDEVDNVDEVLRRVRAAVPEADVLVVDGVSTDGTPELVERLGTELGNIAVLRQGERNGLGGAYRAGFAQGLADGYDVLLEMDADLSHDPSDLPRLVAAAADGARLAIGSRYVAGGTIPNWPFLRRCISRGGNLYVNLVLGLHVRDATAGFRAYRAETLREIGAGSTRAGGYAFQVEMAYRVARTGGGIVELPITFHDRVRGSSKMSLRIVAEAMLLVTRWGVRDRLLRRSPRPGG
jgi:dolichol-phosphate mannosyltransferase